MKRFIMLAMVMVTMLVSLGGCYPGYYPDHDRGEGRDRGERHDRDREGGHDRGERHYFDMNGVLDEKR
jgi:predicted small lipoprotein YifL